MQPESQGKSCVPCVSYTGHWAHSEITLPRCSRGFLCGRVYLHAVTLDYLCLTSRFVISHARYRNPPQNPPPKLWHTPNSRPNLLPNRLSNPLSNSLHRRPNRLSNRLPNSLPNKESDRVPNQLPILLNTTAPDWTPRDKISGSPLISCVTNQIFNYTERRMRGRSHNS